MPKIICVANQVYGAGKTTTAVNIAACLALAEKKTLLIDCDPQGDATRFFIDSATLPGKNLYHLLAGTAEPKDVLMTTAFDCLEFLPSGTELFQTDSPLRVITNKEMILRDRLASLRDRFDHIIIDSPSSLGFLTVCSLAAADSLLLPLWCRPDAVTQLAYLLQLAVSVRQRLNSEFKISGALFTRCETIDEARRVIDDDAFKSIEDIVLSETIPALSDLRDVAGQRQPEVSRDIMSAVSRRYLDLTATMMRAA